MKKYEAVQIFLVQEDTNQEECNFFDWLSNQFIIFVNLFLKLKLLWFFQATSWPKDITHV